MRTLWRVICYFGKAAGLILTTLIGVVDLNEGLPHVVDRMNNWGVLAPILRGVAYINYLIINHGIGLILVISTVGFFAYIFVGVPKKNAEREFKEKRKKLPVRKQKKKQ